MDRVFQSGAAASPPSPPASPSAGYATSGSPLGGIPPTYPGPWWYHMISEELRKVITDAGLTPDHLNLSQLSGAIQALISATVTGAPVGSVLYVHDTAAPSGYLKANGAAVSRTTYSALYAKIGTAYGAGDGSTTFNLPDLRGEFIRGLDDGRGVDTGRVLGSAQTDDLKSHTHTYTVVSSGGGSAPDSGSTGSYGLTRTTAATGGAETRPRNRALLACIKY